MRKIMLAVAMLLASTTAYGADLKTPAPLYKAPPVVSSFNWSGIYLDGFVDYGANFAGSTVATAGNTTVIDLGTMPHGPGVGGGLEALYQPSGSDWVFGVRAEIGYANLQATGAVATAGVNSLSLSNATNYLGAVNGEVGYTLDPRLLAYLTGGFAFGGAHPNLTAIGTSQAISDTAVGWDVGAGLRYAVTPLVSVFIEGDYYQLGDRSLSIGTPPTFTSTVKSNILEQKVGLTFKLGG